MDIRKFLKSSSDAVKDASTQEVSQDTSKPSTSLLTVDSYPSTSQSTDDHSTHSGSCAKTDKLLMEGFPDEPYQPDCASIPVQTLGNRTLKFQGNWFKKFTWLHFDANVGGVLCHICATANNHQLLDLAKNTESVFSVQGFTNWKKALQKFETHEKSASHKLAVQNVAFMRKQDAVNVQINKGLQTDQEKARQALLKLVSSMKYLAHQGLAIRGSGRDETSGNFMQLLHLRCEDDKNLEKWLSRKQSFVSWDIQNEILQIMSHKILRSIIREINCTKHYALIIDGTQDVEGKEQESICIRYVTDTLDIREDCMGLYEVSSTTGEALSRMIQDALIRFQLPIENLRAQTYDGASNMSGVHHGCQAEIKRIQPLASYVHCGAHCTHLVTSKAIECAAYMRDALNNVHELGKLYGASGKFKNLYLNLHADSAETPAPSRLKPICPTRWLTRQPAVESVLQNYSDVIDALQDAASTFGSNTACRANGLLTSLSSGKTMLGLLSALPVLSAMERLNRGLQGKDITVASMLESANLVKADLQHMRSENSFSEIFTNADKQIEQLDLNEISAPRRRKVPKRFQTGNAPQQQFSSVEEHYRSQFFAAIDAAIKYIEEYFASPDLDAYRKLSGLLISTPGTEGSPIDQNAIKPVIQKYPELEPSLEDELNFYRRHYHGSSVEDHRLVFQSMEKGTRKMFPQVERLLRLLLVSPGSSCTAERSFSALRRLKSWLRSTMTQERLNHVMVCHIHRSRLAELSCQEVAEAFVKAKDNRMSIFGHC